MYEVVDRSGVLQIPTLYMQEPVNHEKRERVVTKIVTTIKKK